MVPKIPAPAASVLFFILAAGLACYAWRQKTRLETSLEALLQKQAALTAKIQQTQFQVAAGRKSEVELRERIKSMHASKPLASTEDDFRY